MLVSLSAMTWFAIANKLREKKRLPYWLRWLAIDYMSWIVGATSMHRKAIRISKQESKTSSLTPVAIPLIAGNTADYANHSMSTRDSLPSKLSNRNPNESAITPTVWIRRPLYNARLSASNGSENRRTNNFSRKSRQSTDVPLTKNQESLYAIHIINRLVFLMFLTTVIIINIYTWFFYSRTIKTKLLDYQTFWTCFDESRLQVVNCNETFK
jgi:hypothetical protein